MSETLSRREIDRLLEIIQCASDEELERKVFLLSLRIKLRRFFGLLLRREDRSPSDEFISYLTEPVLSGPARIYPCPADDSAKQ